MTWAIKDTTTGYYFSAQASNTGWYNPDISRARFYISLKSTAQVIARGGHHITYPGNRKLMAVWVTIKEGQA